MMLPLLLAKLAALFVLFTAVVADHQTCNDKGVGNEPDKHGYTKFCDTDQHEWADYRKDPVERWVQFLCKNTSTVVADWNILRPSVLELGTPCNGGGYARKTACNFSSWGACLTGGALIGNGTTDCRFWNQWNDCEWPTGFSEGNLPQSMTIWHK